MYGTKVEIMNQAAASSYELSDVVTGFNQTKFDLMTACSLEQNIDGLTDGNDGDTKVSAFFVMFARI